MPIPIAFKAIRIIGIKIRIVNQPFAGCTTSIFAVGVK